MEGDSQAAMDGEKRTRLNRIIADSAD